MLIMQCRNVRSHNERRHLFSMYFLCIWRVHLIALHNSHGRDVRAVQQCIVVRAYRVSQWHVQQHIDTGASVWGGVGVWCGAAGDGWPHGDVGPGVHAVPVGIVQERHGQHPVCALSGNMRGWSVHVQQLHSHSGCCLHAMSRVQRWAICSNFVQRRRRCNLCGLHTWNIHGFSGAFVVVCRVWGTTISVALWPNIVWSVHSVVQCRIAVCGQLHRVVFSIVCCMWSERVSRRSGGVPHVQGVHGSMWGGRVPRRDLHHNCVSVVSHVLERLLPGCRWIRICVQAVRDVVQFWTVSQSQRQHV
jgi:hypothetical protein